MRVWVPCNIDHAAAADDSTLPMPERLALMSEDEVRPLPSIAGLLTFVLRHSEASCERI